MSSEPQVDRIGTLIDGRYQITEVMASGAMGTVYKAERVPVGKLVAIKFLHASFASDSEFQARFERETRAFHPHLTLGRVVGDDEAGAFRGLDALVAELTYNGKVEVRSVELMRSQTAKGGSQYSVVSSHPLMEA